MSKNDWLVTGGIVVFFVVVNAVIIWSMYNGYIPVPEGGGYDYICIP